MDTFYVRTTHDDGHLEIDCFEDKHKALRRFSEHGDGSVKLAEIFVIQWSDSEQSYRPVKLEERRATV